MANKKEGRRGKKPNMELTDKQLQLIQLLVWSDMTKTQMYEEVGISNQTACNWYAKEIFMKELQRERQIKWQQYADKAQGKLIRLCEQDDDKRTQLQAIKLILEQTKTLEKDGEGADKTQKEIVVKLVDFNKEEE